MILFKNFARSTLAGSINTLDTAITVASGEGALFPAITGSNYFMAVLVNTSGQREVIKVTARATDAMTIERGQEGSTPLSFTAGDRISHRYTAGSFDAMTAEWSGMTEVEMSADANYTLATEEERAMILDITSAVSLTAARNVVVPDDAKMRLVKNSTTGGQSIVVKTSAGTGITIKNGKIALLYTDGTNVTHGETQFYSFDIAEALTLTGIISPAQITGDTNNYAPTDFATASVVRLSSDAKRLITGLAGGASGRYAFLVNVDANPIVLVKESASSTAANRFAMPEDLTLFTNDAAVLHYDATSSRWRLVYGPQRASRESTQTLTDGATVTWDTHLGRHAKVTLGGNRTFAAPTNATDGTYLLHVIQDGTGSRTITWNAVFKWPLGVAPTLSTAAGSRDLLSFAVENGVWYGSFLKGMA